jgi:hypothetical protein
MPHQPHPKPTGDGNAEQTMFAIWDVCPNCGCGPAIVFPSPRDREPDGQPKLVCILCGPKLGTDS